jgi:hypothetical protein
LSRKLCRSHQNQKENPGIKQVCACCFAEQPPWLDVWVSWEILFKTDACLGLVDCCWKECQKCSTKGLSWLVILLVCTFTQQPGTQSWILLLSDSEFSFLHMHWRVYTSICYMQVAAFSIIHTFFLWLTWYIVGFWKLHHVP